MQVPRCGEMKYLSLSITLFCKDCVVSYLNCSSSHVIITQSEFIRIQNLFLSEYKTFTNSFDSPKMCLQLKTSDYIVEVIKR